jgi:hypothetical protein
MRKKVWKNTRQPTWEFFRQRNAKEEANGIPWPRCGVGFLSLFRAVLFGSSSLLFGGLDDFLDLLSFRGAARLLSIRACRTLCARVAFLINDLE